MGGGGWDTSTYTTAKVTRAATKTADFAYSSSATSVHPDMDAKRISNKPFGRLESCDSDEHPVSVPIIVSFDVTGSNSRRAVEAQAKLPALMEMLMKYIDNPQISMAANDDVLYVGANAFQMSEFESDNRIDDHIRKLWITNAGGGNREESYDLVLYAAARKTKIDSFDKRGKKGYLFMYADENIPAVLTKQAVNTVFGDTIEADIPIEALVAEVQERWNIFLISPHDSYITGAKDQYRRLFGDEHVLELQQPSLICEIIATTVGMWEGKADANTVVNDLKALGIGDSTATSIVATASKAVTAAATGSSAKTTKKADRL